MEQNFFDNIKAVFFKIVSLSFDADLRNILHNNNAIYFLKSLFSSLLLDFYPFLALISFGFFIFPSVKLYNLSNFLLEIDFARVFSKIIDISWLYECLSESLSRWAIVGISLRDSTISSAYLSAILKCSLLNTFLLLFAYDTNSYLLTEYWASFYLSIQALNNHIITLNRLLKIRSYTRIPTKQTLNFTQKISTLLFFSKLPPATKDIRLSLPTQVHLPDTNKPTFLIQNR